MADGPAQPDAGGLGRRLLWFLALYGGSIGVFTALVYTLRAIVPH